MEKTKPNYNIYIKIKNYPFKYCIYKLNNCKHLLIIFKLKVNVK